MKDARKDTVLVIDDDPDLRSLIAEVGSLVNVRVIHAQNCCEGIQVYEQEKARIKLILLDYFMPGMTPSACSQALQEKVSSDVPIILVTASVDPAERAAELKISRWISKPFKIEFMQDVLLTAEI